MTKNGQKFDKKCSKFGSKFGHNGTKTGPTLTQCYIKTEQNWAYNPKS